MKILILTDKLNIGGAETHISQLAISLQKHGENVFVASSGGSLSNVLEKRGIVQIRMPLQTHSPIRWLFMRHRIRKIIKQEGISVAHAHARIPAFLISGVRHLGCSEIVTVHAKFRAGFLRRILSRWGENSIAVSEDLRTYLHNVYQIPMQRIEVIPNGIDLSRFSPEKEKTDTSPLRILFASRLDEDCSLGAELLCKIAPTLAQQLSNVAITIVGGGQKMPEIAECARKINYEIGFACVTLRGAVQDMAPILQEQDIFIGVSRVALEAAACGCSVILCGNEGYGGVLKKETFFEASLSNFCARGSEEPTAEKLLCDILELANSPKLRKKHSVECRQLLEEWYDSTFMCKKTLDVYQKSLHIPHRKTVVIGGYFGCGNLGDDAILQAFIEYTRAHYPDIRVWALTKKPSRDAHRFGVRCFNRKNPFSLTCAFLSADAFLCGGGSLLQNLTGKLSLYYYLFMLRLAKLCGATPILFAAGIGPLHGKKALSETKKTLLKSAYISLRDEESLRLLRTQNIDSAKLHLGADAAFLLPPPSIFRTYALLKRIDVMQNQRYVCVSLKSGKESADNRTTIIAALRMFCREADVIPVFVPLDRGDVSTNADAARRLNGRLFIADEPSDVTAVLRNAELLLSMRLHGLILATTVSLPSVGIPTADDQKIPSFCRLAAQDYLDANALSVAAVVEMCQKIYTNKEALRPLIADAYCDLQKNAQKDLENIVRMVYNRGRYSKKSEETL